MKNRIFVQDYKKALFKQFNTTYPLIQLRKKQLSLQPCIMIKDAFSNQKIIGGVDVSYRDREAYAAYVAIDYYTHDILHTQTTHMKVNFPYIPTYLAYRELPVIKKLMKDSTIVIGPESLSHDLEQFNGKALKIGEFYEFKDIKISLIPAYTIKKGTHPKSAGGAGTIIETEGKRIYHAGDTERIPEMKDLKDITVALLPCGGSFTMDFEESTDCALDFKPQITSQTSVGLGNRLVIGGFLQQQRMYHPGPIAKSLIRSSPEIRDLRIN